MVKLKDLFILIWNSRYTTLICSLLANLVAGNCNLQCVIKDMTKCHLGTLYNFSAYAPSLKSDLGYTQTQINLVGIFGNLGVLVIWDDLIDIEIIVGI